jgi:HAD superfamily hydrolase (TIGR01549 family)
MLTKAIIFDVDGTLVDTNGLHAAAWVEAFRHFGIEVALEDVRHQMGKGGDQLMPVFLSRHILDEKGQKIEEYRGNLFKQKYLAKARPFPGVRPLFERIRQEGQKIILASSGKSDEIEAYKKLADISDLVDASTTKDDAEHSKPFPDIFRSALSKISPLRAKDAVVVGDSPFDAQAAAKLGLRTVGVLCGGFPEAELSAAGCIRIYRDPEDLLQGYEHSPLRVHAA